jgi:hypothetical protein
VDESVQFDLVRICGRDETISKFVHHGDVIKKEVDPEEK